MNKFISIDDLLKYGTLVICQGGIHVTNNIAKDLNNSAVSFGANSTNNVTNNYSKEAENYTKTLLDQLKKEEIDPEVKKELSEIIEEAQSAYNPEKPKRTVLKSLLESSKGIIDTVAKTPALIEAYTKWFNFFQNPPAL